MKLIKLDGKWGWFIKCYLIFSFCLFWVFINNFGLSAEEAETIIFKDVYKQFLYENDIPIHYTDDGFLFEENLRLEEIIRFLDLLTFEYYIIANNIQNVNITRALDGEPFRRNFIYVNNGNIEIIKDNLRPTRFVYDPTHPDANLTGERQ